ncbi:hypothetical protein AB6A40_005272 [Gnathostoma spinigerum]|uniref:Uncharacterized protein n=1 Tax=Gnathostoma spinigerum TaxID=75299 RepID=A0ABD6EEZ4_9BILA
MSMDDLLTVGSANNEFGGSTNDSNILESGSSLTLSSNCVEGPPDQPTSSASTVVAVASTSQNLSFPKRLFSSSIASANNSSLTRNSNLSDCGSEFSKSNDDVIFAPQRSGG